MFSNISYKTDIVNISIISPRPQITPTKYQKIKCETLHKVIEFFSHRGSPTKVLIQCGVRNKIPSPSGIGKAYRTNSVINQKLNTIANNKHNLLCFFLLRKSVSYINQNIIAKTKTIT